MAKESKFSRKNLTPFHYFLGLFAINLVVMTIAGIFYNGSFHFWTDPLSDLGDAFNAKELPNPISSFLYSADMALSAFVMFLIANRFRSDYKMNIFKPALGVIGGLGAIIAAFSPDDIRHSYHAFGSGMLVASLWALALIYLFDIRKNVGRMKFAILQILLQIPILAYAGTYFLSIEPLSYILQKFAFAALVFVLIFSAYKAERLTS